MLKSAKRIANSSLIGLGLIASVSACGPRARINPEFSSATSRIVAVLPSEYPAGAQRERVDYIRSLFRSELESAGYILLDDGVVSRSCSNTTCCSNESCAERSLLASKFGVASFASVHIESIARNNFLAGYLNAIDGNIQFSNPQGRETLNVKHTESERGGLLFNSGQILQGVTSQIENAGEGPGFQRLASKFVQALVSKVPRVDRKLTGTADSQVSIQSVDVKPLTNPIYEICLLGTPGAQAAVVLNRQGSNLRELGSGRYCGVYHIADLGNSGGTFEVELRSVFGDSARQEVRTLHMAACDLRNKVQVIETKNRSQIVVQPDVAAQRAKLLIYRSQDDGSSFLKVAETTSPSWVDSSSAGKILQYQVVCVDKQGVVSLPEPAQATALSSATSSTKG